MPAEMAPSEMEMAAILLSGGAVAASLALLAGGTLGGWLAGWRRGGPLAQALLAGLTALCLPGAGGLQPWTWARDWSAQMEMSEPCTLALMALLQAGLAVPLVALLARAPLAAGWARHGRALRSSGAGFWRASWLVAGTRPGLWVALWLAGFARTLLDLAAAGPWREMYRGVAEPPWALGLLGLGLLAAVLAGLVWPPARNAD